MGIAKFFPWFKDKFYKHITRINHNKTIYNQHGLDPVSIDNLMVDMNGIIHNSAQRVYEYGNYKPLPSLLGQLKKPINYSLKQLDLFKDVCDTIDYLLYVVKPKKRLILCIDGPAPMGKIIQQRKRRFVSSLERKDEDNTNFDSNCISPGTKFMDNLSKYMDWYIRNSLNHFPNWKEVEVIFSDEKCPGEGEHKLISYMRKYGLKQESYCLHGMDADLIMLALGTHFPKFWILRDELMDSRFDYYFIDIGKVHIELSELMRWNNPDKEFSPEKAINDFIYMCFTVGNDFLPHVPSIEILCDGIDIMLRKYKIVGETHGHLTRTCLKIRRRAVGLFLSLIAQEEQKILEDKMLVIANYLPDNLLEKHCKFIYNPTRESVYTLDIDSYKKEYYKNNLPEVEDLTSEDHGLEKLCHEYIEGTQWVLSYYTKGVPNWNWRYLHHYAPFSSTLAKYVETYTFREETLGKPLLPFIQLLSILPPKSSKLLPVPLDTILTTSLKEYCPSEFIIDTSGKKQAWEGTVILPILDSNIVEKEYLKLVEKVDEKERKRNVVGKSFLYKRGGKPYVFKSFFGDFNSDVELTPFEL